MTAGERPDGTPAPAYQVTTLLHRRPELRPIASLAAVLDEQIRWSA